MTHLTTHLTLADALATRDPFQREFALPLSHVKAEIKGVTGTAGNVKAKAYASWGETTDESIGYLMGTDKSLTALIRRFDPFQRTEIAYPLSVVGIALGSARFHSV